MEFDRFSIVLLVRGPNATSFSDEEAAVLELLLASFQTVNDISPLSKTVTKPSELLNVLQILSVNAKRTP